MRKSLFLVSFLFCSTLSVWSQEEDYAAKVDMEAVKLNTAKKINKLLLKYSFPNDYEKTLELHIADFEYNKELFKHKYTEDTRKQKIDSLVLDFENWREFQILASEKATKLWRKIISKHTIEDVYQQTYTNYHFYLALDNPSVLITSKIKALASGSSLKNLSKIIAKQEAKRVFSKCSALKKLDPIAKNYAGKELYNYLNSTILDKLASFSIIEMKRNSDVYCSYAHEKGKEKQTEIDSDSKQQEDESFVAKAIEIGLDAEKAHTILQLIKKRNDALEARKKALEEGDSMAELFENTDTKTKSEIKKEFAKNLSQLMNRKQFAALFGEVFMKNYQKKTSKKMQALQEIYTLSEEQITSIRKMIATFYFNEEVITAYYSFDKKLKKQKLSALRFRFEKDYKTLMDSYGLKAKTVKKAHQRTYQWD